MVAGIPRAHWNLQRSRRNRVSMRDWRNAGWAKRYFHLARIPCKRLTAMVLNLSRRFCCIQLTAIRIRHSRGYESRTALA